MHVGLDADQHALRDAAAAMLAATCTTAHVRAAYLAPPDASRERWRQLASVGLTSITTPVELGGVGRDDVDLAVLMEEAGYVALPEPLSAAATAAALLTEVAPEVAARLLPELASGDLMLALSLPGEPFVEHADAADLFVTADGDAVFVLEPGDVRIEAQASVDGSRRLHRVEVLRRTPVARGATAVARALDRATLCTAAELIGLGRRCLDLSVAHARERHQFGRPIGSYQALKHRLADDWIALEFARPLVWRAAWALARDLPHATLFVSAAKAAAGDAATRASRSTLQVHGAMGYTFDCDVQLFLKRILSLASAYGDARHHRRRIARVLRARDIERAP